MKRRNLACPTNSAARLLILAATLLVGFLAAPAWAEFDPPFNLSSPSSSGPQVAFDGSGGALFAWWRGGVGTYNRIEIRTRSDTGVLGNVQRISRAEQSSVGPKLAMNAAGNAVIVWQALYDDPPVPHFRIQLRTRSATGELGKILVVSATGRAAGNHQVAINSNGEAMIVWERYVGTHQRIQARGLSSTGVLGPLKTLSPAGFHAYNPKVAIRNDGDALIVWQRSDNTGAFYRVEARTQSVLGVVGGLQRISELGQLAAGPEVAMDDAGNALIFWTGSDGTHQQVKGRSRNPAGSLGPIEKSPGGTHTAGPAIAMLPNGDALIAWLRMEGGPHFLAQALTRSAAGVYGPLRTLSRIGQPANLPRVAINSEGDAVVVWPRSDGTHNRIQARTHSAAGALGPLQTISQRGRNTNLPQVAIDSDGDALVVWNQTDAEGTGTTEAAAGP